MNSPIKLPPRPPMDVGVSGQVKFAYSQEALDAYAAQAVREALAALKIDERAEFEAAVQEEYGTSAPSMLLRDADGDYLTLNTEWVFWLKRATLTAAPPKENNHGDTP
ncbi:hypothetical protein [Achromobacter xylosoxidans]|uniref:hypothetical protein n=1 Tax=Alcaligenes xylosoxydans xylosoxydans TaxID=85698 RepID=UPI001F14057E|nr:hypothetical protein [Achromobacter xylosoxidans]